MSGEKGSVDAILMASGFSRRFGSQNKLLAPFLGSPLLVHPLRLLCSSGLFGQVYVTTAAPEVRQLAAQFPVTLLDNPCPENGMRQSVRLGACASGADYLLFAQADQPLLDLDTLRLILAARSPGLIIQPSFAGRPGSPVLFSSIYKEELASLAPGEHARDILRRHPEAVIRLPLSSALPLMDIDLPEDLARLETLQTQPSPGS